MNGLQWRIDQVRKSANMPPAACLKISSIMWDSAIGESGLAQAIGQLQQGD